MENNDTLRSVRYALDLSNKRVVELCGLGGVSLSPEQCRAYLAAESDAQRLYCPDRVLAAFLNGLISDRRGARGDQREPESRLTNNLVLKKLRIAFALRDDDVLKLVQSAGCTLSRAELNAVFQRPGHKNYKECGDQLLRQFLSGVTRRFRVDT